MRLIARVAEELRREYPAGGTAFIIARIISGHTIHGPPAAGSLLLKNIAAKKGKNGTHAGLLRTRRAAYPYEELSRARSQLHRAARLQRGESQLGRKGNP